MVKLVDPPAEHAGVVELVDTHGSGPCGSNVVGVRASSPVQVDN